MLPKNTTSVLLSFNCRKLKAIQLFKSSRCDPAQNTFFLLVGHKSEFNWHNSEKM